jgi:DNA-binding HxlR family transcriptional regulator
MSENADRVNFTTALVDRDAWSAEACSMDRALKLIGKRSNMLLLREAYYGSTRFDEFVRRSGLSEPVVSRPNCATW